MQPISTQCYRGKKIRLNQIQEISSIIHESVLEKRRYYLKKVIASILFLVKNELSLRGNWNDDENTELGLFQSFFKEKLENDEYLQSCQAIMPANAKTSPQIQNELILFLF